MEGDGWKKGRECGVSEKEWGEGVEGERRQKGRVSREGKEVKDKERGTN